MDTQELKDLLRKFEDGTCTEQEKAMLTYWLHHLNAEGESGLTEDELVVAQEEMWREIKPAKKIGQKFYWSAAAVLVFAMLAIAGYFALNNDKQYTDTTKVAAAPKIKPGGNNAVLILANGTRIALNDAANGHIANQAGLSISKKADGQLVYTVLSNEESGDTSQSAYNTLQTPRGGQYQLNLPDGSKVWLNAVSSLRFPLKFGKGQRLVELEGEGYFEVAHVNGENGKRVPFMVKTIGHAGSPAGQIVEVLGTHFNINAYTDEHFVKTTLLEGSVRVRQLTSDEQPVANFRLLKPGQQSVLENNSIAVVQADTEAAVAWKNGYFRFNDESLESIMRKVSKWYDVEVSYQNEALKKELFAGVTTRFSNVNELLKILELTGEVKFKVEGRKILAINNKK